MQKQFSAHLSLRPVAAGRVNQRLLVRLNLVDGFLEKFFAQQIVLFFTVHNHARRWCSAFG